MARRKLVWARMAPAITTLTGNGTNSSLESQDLLESFRTQAGISRGPVGLTVMRVRLAFSYYTAVTAAVNDIFAAGGIYYGVRKFSFNELANQDLVEQTNLGPQQDPHADWMAWGRIPIRDASFNALMAPIAVGAHWEVDVRSMRKIDELGETLGLVIQVPSAGQTITNVIASASTLVALP